MKQMKKSWYVDRWYFLFFVLGMLVCMLGVAYNNCETFWSKGDSFFYTNHAAGARITLNMEAFQSNLTVFTAGCILLVVLLYSFGKTVLTEDFDRWVLLRMLPVSKKMRFIADYIEILVVTGVFWIGCTGYYVAEVQLTQRSFLARGEMLHGFLGGDVILTMVKMLPVALLYASIIYLLLAVSKAVTGNACLAIINLGMWFIGVVIADNYAGLFDFLYTEESGYVSLFDLLDNRYIFGLAVATVILFAIALVLTNRKDESKLLYFHYRWAEIVFEVCMFITVFLFVKECWYSSGNVFEEFIRYDASFLCAVILTGSVYFINHRNLLENKKRERV